MSRGAPLALALNGSRTGADPGNEAALIRGSRILAARPVGGRGAANEYAAVVRDLLQDVKAGTPDLLTVVKGPGSFTGLRTSIALALGLGQGWDRPVIGVSVGEALRLQLGEKQLNVMTAARRGRWFVESPDGRAVSLPIGEVMGRDWGLTAGDAFEPPGFTPEMRLDFTGRRNEILWDRGPASEAVYQAACIRWAELGYPCGFRATAPLYVEAPLASPPAGGLRPPPAEAE